MGYTKRIDYTNILSWILQVGSLVSETVTYTDEKTGTEYTVPNHSGTSKISLPRIKYDPWSLEKDATILKEQMVFPTSNKRSKNSRFISLNGNGELLLSEDDTSQNLLHSILKTSRFQLPESTSFRIHFIFSICFGQ